jgi:hypothetical protein
VIGGSKTRPLKQRAVWAFAAFLGVALTLAAGHALALNPGQLTATPLPILSSATSSAALPLPDLPVSSSPLPTSSESLPKQAPPPPTSPNLEGALPTIGEGQSTTESPSPTTSSSSGSGGPEVNAENGGPEASPTMSSSPSGNPTSKPSYNGGFYTKPASSSKAPAAVIGPPNPKDMAFDPNDGSPGEEQGAGMGEGANVRTDRDRPRARRLCCARSRRRTGACPASTTCPLSAPHRFIYGGFVRAAYPSEPWAGWLASIEVS